MLRKINSLLFAQGLDILLSDEFGNALTQTHHNVSTVASHTLGVAVVSLTICYLLMKLHIRTNTQRMTRAALCHDLGILGRDEKYRDNVQCCFQHPKDSVEVVRKLVGEDDPALENAVANHMWPLCLHPPGNREGVILSVADKISSFLEITGHCPGDSLVDQVIALREGKN